MGGSEIICQNCKKDFAIEPEDFDFYKKMQVPPPTWCWICRAHRRFTWRNERMLYKRPSDATGKEIFCMYSPDSNTKIYENDYWYSDAWDALDYGKDVDFTRPFFEQVGELIHSVPLLARSVVRGINSDYVNNAGDVKNSYLIFNGNRVDDSMYSNGINVVQDCVDISHCSDCESCYECFWMTKCSRCYYSVDCENSYDLWFSKDCGGSSNCFGCVGLRGKQYYIFNEPYTKEEYQKKIKSYNLASYAMIQEWRAKAEAFWLKFPVKNYVGTQNKDISGNYISASKNVHYGYLVRNSENLKYCSFVQEEPYAKDCMDYSIWGGGTELAYECHSCGLGASNIKFCAMTYTNVRDIEYSYMCIASENLFGCVSVRNKQYCILNKQYTPDEYKAMVAKIKAHMVAMPYVDKMGRAYPYGEFFPAELSPFGYNECLSQEYFPLSREQALAQGYKWSEQTNKNYQITIQASQMPDTIDAFPADITQQIFGCEHDKKCQQVCIGAFRVTPNELIFYKKSGLPLPRLCPSCRTFERFKHRTPFTLYDRTCNKCRVEIKTAYSPDRPEIIYCEPCYQAEVI